jgi:fructose-1,6-bisphosphatase/inositol monophosphatase family enzyme
MNDSRFDEIPALLAQAAQELMLPRFRQLQTRDIEEKSPGELVTVVDREVEVMLSPALQRIVPGSRVVGEEACAAQPALLAGLQQGLVWLLDPLDGTGNFIGGRRDFAILVALLRDGETVAAWMLDPMNGTLYAAQRGGGAWRDSERLQVSKLESDPNYLRGIVKTRFLPADVKQRVMAAPLRETQPGANCTAVDYPGIVRGDSDFALYWRTLPWDHAPGVLFLQEAGGCVARLDGSAYLPHETREGLLAASDAVTWQRALDTLGFERSGSPPPRG